MYIALAAAFSEIRKDKRGDWMQTLTPRERFLNCCLGRPVDHVPYGVGLGWWPWEDALERWREESGKKDLDIVSEFGLERFFASPPLRQNIWPLFEEKVLRDEGEYIVRRNGRGITERMHKHGTGMPEFLDYPVKTPADWARIKRERLDPDAPGRVDVDWEAFRKRASLRGETVVVGDFPNGVFGYARELMGAEELLIAFYTEPEMVRDMMEHLTTLWLSLWERVAAETRIDWVHIWEDMSGRQGSLISPAMVEQFMMPQYDRIADFARRHGIEIMSVDSDGDVSELVPVMMRHGVNLYLPFEVQAGCDILEYRRKYPTLAINGGLDKRALAAGKAAIDREVAKAREMVRRGRYIPGFDHLIPSDVPWENYRYAALALKDVCYGG